MVTVRLWLLPLAVMCLHTRGVAAQTPPAHEHPQPVAQSKAWHFMQDGVAFLTFNRQGGPRGTRAGSRGGEEFGSQNWWMGSAERPVAAGTLRLNLMLSLEPATLGSNGYRQIFQSGETLYGEPLVNRQHPHDFLMQAAAVWRVPMPRGYTLTIAGAPVGEPAFGPVAFMHRLSASENPTAPLSHHTFDSTHIAMGVFTGGLDRTAWHAEVSVFHGQEPDEDRWDLMDPGPLDSWAVRGWYRPNAAWTFQVSHAFLTNPEVLDPGNIRKTSASASFVAHRPDGWTAATVAYGRRNHPGADYNALLAEATHAVGRFALYGRLETLQVESDLLRFGFHGFTESRKTAHVADGVGGVDVLTAVTLGGLRSVFRRSGWDAGVGADVTFYAVPAILRPTHGDHPVSFHLFARVRPPSMMRMSEMTMAGR